MSGRRGNRRARRDDEARARGEEFRQRIEFMQTFQNASKLVNNITDDELHTIFDPRFPKPPREIHPCPCECHICWQQFRKAELQASDLKQAYEKKLTDSEAMSLNKETVDLMEFSYTGLQAMWGAHGKTIAARWRKKSRVKRVEFLHRFELEPKQWKEAEFVSKARGIANWQKSRAERTAWLLPWLNVESLKDDPMRLISLLHNRARFPPEEWAPLDNRNLNFAYNQGFLSINYSTLCVQMHGENYGTLVPWNKEAAHRLDIVAFPRGQLILEAQEELMSILCDIADELVQGLGDDDVAAGRLEHDFEFPKIDQKRSGRTELWSRFTNQPFSEPPNFDLEFIKSLAQAKVNSFGDHLWLLQTDPAYQRRTVRSLISAIPDRDGVTVSGRTAYLIAITEINVDHGWYASWGWILEEVKRVESLRLQYIDEIQKGKPLPAEYDIALQALEMLVSQQIDNREKALEDSIPQRSGFRDLFDFDYSTGTIRWRLKMGARKDDLWDGLFYESDPLYWCVSNFYSHPPDRLKYQPSMLFSWLDEYLMTASVDQKRRIDERLYEQLSDYAALNETLNIIQLHRPGTGQLPTQELMEKCKGSSKAYRFARQEVDMEKITKLQKKYGDDLGTINPLVEFIHAYDADAQVGKKTDQMRLKRFDTIQNAQDLFWTKLRAFHEAIYRQARFSNEDIEAALAPFAARQDAKFLGGLEAERQKLVNRIEQASQPAPQKESAISPPWQFTSDEKQESSRSSSTTKTKTRPEITLPIRQPDLTAPPGDSEPSLEPTFTPIQVKQQTYTILSNMFTSSDTTAAAAKKTIDWDAFVNAMVDVGFSARHSSGSAVIFEIDNWDLNWVGKIVFHKPHPVAKIDSVIFRGMGRRMEKWFGWNERTFALKG